MRHSLLTLLIMVSALAAFGADPTATNYPPEDCQGSLKPYPAVSGRFAVPDTLTPVYISHVGRHGSRYPASANHCVALQRALYRADSAGTITPLGRKLRGVVDHVISLSHNRWGALDSLGEAEQRGIASRMLNNFPKLFNNGRVNAISSYSPRCMMSMFSFTHQLDRLNNHNQINTSTGRQYSSLMRPFDTNHDYTEFIQEGTWREPYDKFFDTTVPATPAAKVLGADFPYDDGETAKSMSLIEYYVIAGLSAMSVDVNALEYFTREEYNALWSTFNLRQYLQRSASTLSSVPADIASALVNDIISKTDAFIDGTNNATVDLRFGHAETLIPLLSLLRLSGCYYLTNYYDTVGQHWRDFWMVPMAANLQMILLKSRKGNYYVALMLNEQPICLMPNDKREFLPWREARDYMLRCVPLYAQD